MAIETARNGDIELAYETIGPSSDEPLLLISGISQMLIWHDDFCAALVERGFQVARFDNRDIGLSTHLRDLGRPRMTDLLLRPSHAARYQLNDLADDAFAVLDALNWQSAHVVGSSIGAMIAETMASRRPERVRSLTSISSSPSPRLGRPALRAQLGVLKVAKRPVTSGEEYGEHLLELDSVIGSPDYPTDEAWLREYGRRCFERGYDRAGVERLSAVMRASGDRRAELAKITVPTVVIHGLADRIVPPAAGRATAAAIPGARLVTYPGMSSLPPEPLFPAIIDEIVGVAGLGEHRKETGATA